MIIFKESNKVSHSVWHLPKFIQRNHVREYTSLLKSFSADGLMGGGEAEWILNNLDLDATQGLVNPNIIPSRLDRMVESIKNLNRGKTQPESASTYTHDVILNTSSLTPEYKKIIDLDLKFNKQLQKLSDKIIK